MRNIVVGISGASGVNYGIRILETLKDKEFDIHLIITNSAEKIIEIESEYDLDYIKSLATYTYNEKDFTAPIASGSFNNIGLVIAPCSMKTLASISNGVTDNLLTRAADVCLKEKNKLVLVTRETPLNRVHLKNMLEANDAGACILPACPGFYSKPSSIDDLFNIIAGRALDIMGINTDIYRRWRDE